MIPDIENKINLRKKLVEEVTSEILVWSNKETFSFSINKLACFAASNIVDYIIFGKEIYNPYPKKKIIDCCITEDMDILANGCQIFLKNFLGVLQRILI